MIQYIYFVKCPNCEDEHFDFFDEAKEFALGCLSKKPIITQIEVCRNDFGECTDHSDLGTIWSWEDMMKDTEDPTQLTFTRDDIKTDYNPDNDPEFDNIDNSVDSEPEIPEVSAFDNQPDNFRKPITEARDYSRLTPITKKEFQKRLESKESVTIFTGDPGEFGIRSRDYEVSYEDGKYVVSFWDETYNDDFTDSETVEEFDTIDELWDYMVDFMDDSNFSPEYNYVSGKPITESKADPFHEAIFEAIDYLTEFDHIFPVPENIGASAWEELKDDIRYGLSSDFEIAEIIMEYLDKDLAIGKKHPEMFEDDPQSELTLETYNRLKRAYDRAVDDYKAKHAEDFEESCERKPIPEGMTIEQLVETMQENEDTVECAVCEELFPKADSVKHDHGYICPTCSAPVAAEDVFDQEFPEVAVDDNEDDYPVEKIPATTIGRVVADLIVDEFEAVDGYDMITDAIKDSVLPEEKQAEILDVIDHIREEEVEHIEELKDITIEDKAFDDDTLTEASLLDIASAANREFGTGYGEEDFLTGLEDEGFFDELETPTAVGKELYAKRGMNAFGPRKSKLGEATEMSDLGNEYDGGYPTEKPLLPETDEVTDSRLVFCPECGEESFDRETGICVSCGFN